jgi:hypothetical protein
MTGYATKPGAVRTCGTPPSAQAVQEGLQIAPYIKPDGTKGLPRGNYGLYTLTRPTTVAYCASTTANPAGPDGTPYGAGGLPQYYIPGVTGTTTAQDKAYPTDPRFTKTGDIPCAP